MPTGPVLSNLDAYLGALFRSDRRPNTLLRLIGGLQGGLKIANATEFPTGVFYDLRAPSQPSRLEGADAPNREHRTLSQASNVVQIFHEAVEATYLARSDNKFSGVQKLPGSDALQDPRDMTWQVMQALATIAQDANYSFLRGTFANPADPSGTALQTRGLHSAITTHVIDAVGGAGMTAIDYRNLANELHREMVNAFSMLIDDAHVLFCDATQFNNFSFAFESKTDPPRDRRVAGVQVRTIMTRFGQLNLAWEPDMPAGEALAANLTVVGPVGLPVPEKGILFEEPLAKTGSADDTQLYGQLGIDHGPEWMHAKAINLYDTALEES